MRACVVAIGARTHCDEGETLSRRLDRHVLDGLLDRLGVEDVARRHPQPRAHETWVERAHVRLHVDRADPELLALLDHERDHEAARTGSNSTVGAMMRTSI